MNDQITPEQKQVLELSSLLFAHTAQAYIKEANELLMKSQIHTTRDVALVYMTASTVLNSLSRAHLDVAKKLLENPLAQ